MSTDGHRDFDPMREDIRKLISEELARPEIQDQLDQYRLSFWDRVGATLRHPIVLTVLGFGLTTIVGTLVSQSIADRNQRDVELGQALEAVRDFASEASELRVQQTALIATFERAPTTEDLSAAKQAYDEAYLSWHASRYRNYLTIRSFFGFTYDNFAEQAITRTIHQDFRAFNECLNGTHALMSRGDEGQGEPRVSAREEINSCLQATGREGVMGEDGFVDAASFRTEKIFQCSRRIFDVLHHFIAKDIHCGRSSWQPQGNEPALVETLYHQFIEECAVGEVAPFNPHAQNSNAFCTIGADEGGLMGLLP